MPLALCLCTVDHADDKNRISACLNEIDLTDAEYKFHIGYLRGRADVHRFWCGGCMGKGHHESTKAVTMATPGDSVNHPKHYTFGTIEVITVIEDWQLGFHLGNAVKYIARAKHKGREVEDLQKARWYLDRRIETLEKI